VLLMVAMRVQASGLSTSHVSSAADERRIEELFRKLDVNRDGRIDIHDLSEALHRLEVPQLPGHAQVFCRFSNERKHNGQMVKCGDAGLQFRVSSVRDKVRLGLVVGIGFVLGSAMVLGLALFLTLDVDVEKSRAQAYASMPASYIANYIYCTIANF